MKNIVLKTAILGMAVFMISWGSTGHKTVAEIAQRHLSAKSKQVLKALIGDASLASVSNWADEVRQDPAYQATAAWHYLNVPLGLDEQAFGKAVQTETKENIYSALLQNEKALTDPNSEIEVRVRALKFIIHLVGDIHQPMHISRSADKGGNTIQVRFDGKGTNLHSLWDSKLIEHQGLDYKALAAKLEKENAGKSADNSSPLEWLYESYQISSSLYAEIDQTGALLPASYYELHIPTVNKRLNKGGLRLAALLNKLFEAPVFNIKFPAHPAFEPENLTEIQKINIDYVKDFIGQKARVSGQVFGMKKFKGLVLLNIGNPYPDQKLTVVLKDDAAAAADHLDGKVILVTGFLENYKGKPQIVVKDSSHIMIQE